MQSTTRSCLVASCLCQQWKKQRWVQVQAWEHWCATGEALVLALLLPHSCVSELRLGPTGEEETDTCDTHNGKMKVQKAGNSTP